MQCEGALSVIFINRYTTAVEKNERSWFTSGSTVFRVQPMLEHA